jgi:hypothetical protein
MVTARAPHVPPAVPYGWIVTPVQYCDQEDCGGPHWVANSTEEFRCDACGKTTVHCTPLEFTSAPMGEDDPFFGGLARGTVPREDHERHHAFVGCTAWERGPA